MLSNLAKKLNNISNPYIALTEVMDAYHQGASLLKMLELISKSSLANVNEKMFSCELYDVNYRTQGVIISSGSVLESFRNLKYDPDWEWNSRNPEQIFNLLGDVGLDFTTKTVGWKISNDLSSHFTNVTTPDEFYLKVKELNIEPIYSDPVFKIERNPDEHDICIFKNIYKQMGQEEFEKRIAESRAFHTAVILGRDKFIEFLIEECKIDVNIKDRYGNSALLDCRTISTLKLLNNYQLDWTVVDKDGHDCLTKFAKVSSKEDSKAMLDLAHKEMDEAMKKTSRHSASDFMKERVNKTLLEMVSARKTKKELEDFIKKYKVSVADIFDKDGKNLAQVCVENQNWARYNLFKEYYPLEYVSQKGVGTLEILFKMDSVSHQNQAILVFDELLNNNIHVKNKQFAANILVEAFKYQKRLSFPHWFIKQGQLRQFVEKFIGNEHAEKLITNYSDKGPSLRWSTYSSINDETIREAKEKIFFFLTHASLYGKDFDVNNLPVSKIFTESKIESTNLINYKCSDHALENLIGLISVIDENEHLQGFNYQEIWKKFEQDAVQHIIKTVHQSHKDKYNSLTSFVSHNKHLMNFLLDKKSELFTSILTDDFIKNFSVDVLLQKKMNYNRLDSKIPYKDNTQELKKINKI